MRVFVVMENKHWVEGDGYDCWERFPWKIFKSKDSAIECVNTHIKEIEAQIPISNTEEYSLAKSDYEEEFFYPSYHPQEIIGGYFPSKESFGNYILFSLLEMEVNE
jgi:hypothetical protein